MIHTADLRTTAIFVLFPKDKASIVLSNNYFFTVKNLITNIIGTMLHNSFSFHQFDTIPVKVSNLNTSSNEKVIRILDFLVSKIGWVSENDVRKLWAESQWLLELNITSAKSKVGINLSWSLIIESRTKML